MGDLPRFDRHNLRSAGCCVSAEAPGKVTKIAFESGSAVKKGDLLIQQDTSTEEAQLPGALSQVTLSRANQKRADQMFAEGIISQADHDLAIANSALSQSQVDTIRAAIAKKTIRAPFSGRLGIRQVNLGQLLREGDQIVTLQALDPIFVDFSLPQQQLSQVRIGLPLRLSGDILGNDSHDRQDHRHHPPGGCGYTQCQDPGHGCQ